MVDPRGERAYTVTEVRPSEAIPNEARVWLGDAEHPHQKSLLWDERRRGGFPAVGQVVREMVD